MPLDVPPPRTSRFGSPLVLSRVHWVRPELVAEVKISGASPGAAATTLGASSRKSGSHETRRWREGFELPVPGRETVKPSWEK